jgi:hypothetical protein
MIKTQQEKALALDLLDNPAFKYVFGICFAPIYRSWATTLLNDLNLDDAKRKGLVQARLAFKQGFNELFTNCGVKMPDWLVKELDPL